MVANRKVDVAQQSQHGVARSRRVLLETLDVVVRERKKRSLGTRHERGDAEQDEGKDAEKEDMGGKTVEDNPGNVFQNRGI